MNTLYLSLNIGVLISWSSLNSFFNYPADIKTFFLDISLTNIQEEAIKTDRNWQADGKREVPISCLLQAYQFKAYYTPPTEIQSRFKDDQANIVFHKFSVSVHFDTGRSLIIVFFEDFKIYSGLWPLSVSPRWCQCVYTMAGQTPALQQNLQSSEKSQHFKEKHNI